MPASVHRARVLAWCLGGKGWEVEILTPGIEFQRPEWIDEKSTDLFPLDIACHEAKPMFSTLFRMLRIRGVAWRALLPVFMLGNQILKGNKFDVVYISTTAFNFFCLGRIWQTLSGTPYILDFQDPWFRPGKNIVTTKHRVKFWISSKLAKYLESFSVHGACGIVSVSPNYLQDLRLRYPSADALQSDRQAVIPFGVLPLDFEKTRPVGRRVDCAENIRTITYVGVGASIMRRSFRRLADGIARLREKHPHIVERCRFEIMGTQGGWTPSDPKILFNEAVAAGIGDIVEEDPRIVGYNVAISKALSADGLLVLGVDDPAYMPSKLFLYALTNKPLLACMHWQSQANSYFEKMPELGVLIHFGEPCDDESEQDMRILAFLKDVVARRELDREMVRTFHSADAMASQHVELFNRCLAQQ